MKSIAYPTSSLQTAKSNALESVVLETEEFLPGPLTDLCLDAYLV